MGINNRQRRFIEKRTFTFYSIKDENYTVCHLFCKCRRLRSSFFSSSSPISSRFRLETLKKIHQLSEHVARIRIHAAATHKPLRLRLLLLESWWKSDEGTKRAKRREANGRHRPNLLPLDALQSLCGDRLRREVQS